MTSLNGQRVTSVPFSCAHSQVTCMASHLMIGVDGLGCHLNDACVLQRLLRPFVPIVQGRRLQKVACQATPGTSMFPHQPEKLALLCCSAEGGFINFTAPSGGNERDIATRRQALQLATAAAAAALAPRGALFPEAALAAGVPLLIESVLIQASPSYHAHAWWGHTQLCMWLMDPACAVSGITYGGTQLTGCAWLPAAKEFTPVKDPQDAYSFVYPFGWQEVAVKGQDIVFKDVIEPLESVSVSITQTDKADVTEFGSPAEVC